MKPSLPQGTRDFSADVVRKRSFIFNTIRSVFELYGFQPLETPAMENLETLMGKYGEEGDKLIFKVLNNGLGDPKKIDKSRSAFENVLAGKNDPQLTERALKYDLTIPFARYVATNHGTLSFPFKRYQIQPVWRADRPQKGRYREFYQCDADVVGSNALINEVEFVNIYKEVFTRLAIRGAELRVNSRKMLAALADLCGGADKMMDITIAIDKLDKIGIEKVKEELAGRGLDENQIGFIERYLSIEGTNTEKLDRIRELFGDSETAKKGLEELGYLSRFAANDPDARDFLVIDFTLARGLNYYTGVIFEAKAPPSVRIGSIGGGGRYDDLTGLFGVPNVPGVGISFGVDRIYDVMEELGVFPETLAQGPKALFFNLGPAEAEKAYEALRQVRSRGIAAEMYHEPAKMDRQFKFAERKNIPFAVIIGSRELAENTCIIKDLRSGEQKSLALANLADFLFI